jgi:hypothetical protein
MLRPRRQRDGAAVRRELQGVVEQVRHRLAQQVAVAHQRQLPGQLHLQPLVARFGRGAVQLGHVGHHRHQIGRCKGGAAAPGLHLGDSQHGLEDADNAVEIGDALFDRRPQRLLVLRRDQRVFQLRPGARDRRPQIVGDGVGDPAHAFHQLRDAIEHRIHRLAELVEFVVPVRQRHARRNVARADRGGGAVDRAEPLFQRAPQQPAAEHREGGGGCGGPGDSFGQQAAQPELLRHVAPDQHALAIAEIDAQQPRFRHRPVAQQRDAKPGLLAIRFLRPGLKVTRQLPAIRHHQDVERLVLRIEHEAVVDRGDQRRDVAGAPALDQRGGIGADRRIHLAVERAGGVPPQHHGRRGGRGGEDRGEEQGEAARGAAEQAEQRRLEACGGTGLGRCDGGSPGPGLVAWRGGYSARIM